MNIFDLYRQQLVKVLQQLYPTVGLVALYQVALEVPKDNLHGDLSTNAALVLAKLLGRAPRDLAQEIADHLRPHQDFVAVEIAGPGFINIKLAKAVWSKVVEAVLGLRSDYGRSNIGAKERVNIEFVSANPTGPMHIGHARGAVVGDVIANLLAHCGYDVVREYYINDSGSQIDVLARSLFIRYQQKCGIPVEIPDGCYPGEYLIPVAEQLYQEHSSSLLQRPETETLSMLREIAVTSMMALIRKDLAQLGVQHDIFRSEQHDIKDCGKLEEALRLLKNKDLLYTGILDAPKGKQQEEWEPREQLLFKATDFGDDSDRPIQKSDGAFTYFAADIAYHMDKLQRGFNNMVLLVGSDHGGYTKRIKAAVSALSGARAHIDVLLNQLVNLLQDGKPFKMSKRAGNFITVKEVIDLLDKDILRFVMLTRKCDTVLDLDFTKAQEQSKDNPVFYVQYAHTRTKSILRKAHEADIPTTDVVDYSLLANDSEIGVIKKIAEYPRIIQSAASMHEPHRLPYYLYELATEFHSLWNKGVEQAELRFIVPENLELSKARCALVSAASQVLKSGMELMGVTPLERM